MYYPSTEAIIAHCDRVLALNAKLEAIVSPYRTAPQRNDSVDVVGLPAIALMQARSVLQEFEDLGPCPTL